MLRILSTGMSYPLSWAVDPAASFEPGYIGQLYTMGNQIVLGVSDGTAPLGIIDDIKKNSFHAVSIDEIVIVPVPSSVIAANGNKLVTTLAIKVELLNPNITENSFVSRTLPVVLTARNGVVTFLSGSELNHDADGDGIPDSLRTVVSYQYQIPNVPGDDSTIGSSRVSVWVTRVLFETDAFETNQRYALNSPIFTSESGLLTTRQISEDYPACAIVTGPPTSLHNSLEAIWL